MFILWSGIECVDGGGGIPGDGFSGAQTVVKQTFPRHSKLICGCLNAIAILLLWGSSPAVSADQRDIRLDGLFSSLAKAKSRQEAATIEAGIWRIWAQTDKQNIAQLYSQGLRALHAKNLDKAINLFSQVL